jgi:hypothetical protein
LSVGAPAAAGGSTIRDPRPKMRFIVSVRVTEKTEDLVLDDSATQDEIQCKRASDCKLTTEY